METEQPLYYHMHVGTIIFYLLLTLRGQLGSSNPFVTNNLSLIIYTFSADPEERASDLHRSVLTTALLCATGW